MDRRTLQLEPLERRIVLSTILSADLVDGTLHIQGTDGDDWGIRLETQRHDDGDKIRVAGLVPAQLFDADAVDRILVELGDGHDKLDMVGIDDINFYRPPFAADIEIVDGDGEGRVLGRSIEVEGDLIFRKEGFGRITTGINNSVLHDVEFVAEDPSLNTFLSAGLGPATTVLGDVLMVGGLREEGLRWSTELRAIGGSKLQGSVSVSTPDNVRIEVDSSDLYGNVTINGGLGDDWIYFHESRVHSKLNIAADDGNDLVRFDESALLAKVDIDLGRGNDTALMSGGSDFRKNVDIVLGAGDDLFRTIDTGLGGSATFQRKLSLSFGEGEDELLEDIPLVVLGRLFVEGLP